MGVPTWPGVGVCPHGRVRVRVQHTRAWGVILRCQLTTLTLVSVLMGGLVGVEYMTASTLTVAFVLSSRTSRR